MSPYTIALFGEAEKGEFQTAYFCRTLDQLDEYFGNPPEESKGLFYAVQALLFHRNLIFFRVKEEGFSFTDYLWGFQMLETQKIITDISAIGLPGVGNAEIYDAVNPLLTRYHPILLTTEADLYDYLTNA